MTLGTIALLASFYGAQCAISSEIGTFFTLPRAMPREISQQNNPGSITYHGYYVYHNTNGVMCWSEVPTRRLDATEAAKINLPYEALLERLYFASEGFTNNWDRTISPDEPTNFVFSAHNGWYGMPDDYHPTNRCLHSRRLLSWYRNSDLFANFLQDHLARATIPGEGFWVERPLPWNRGFCWSTSARWDYGDSYWDGLAFNFQPWTQGLAESFATWCPGFNACYNHYEAATEFNPYDHTPWFFPLFEDALFYNPDATNLAHRAFGEQYAYQTIEQLVSGAKLQMEGGRFSSFDPADIINSTMRLSYRRPAAMNQILAMMNRTYARPLLAPANARREESTLENRLDQRGTAVAQPANTNRIFHGDIIRSLPYRPLDDFEFDYTMTNWVATMIFTNDTSVSRALQSKFRIFSPQNQLAVKLVTPLGNVYGPSNRQLAEYATYAETNFDGYIEIAGNGINRHWAQEGMDAEHIEIETDMLFDGYSAARPDKEPLVLVCWRQHYYLPFDAEAELSVSLVRERQILNSCADADVRMMQPGKLGYESGRVADCAAHALSSIAFTHKSIPIDQDILGEDAQYLELSGRSEYYSPTPESLASCLSHLREDAGAYLRARIQNDYPCDIFDPAGMLPIDPWHPEAILYQVGWTSGKGTVLFESEENGELSVGYQRVRWRFTAARNPQTGDITWHFASFEGSNDEINWHPLNFVSPEDFAYTRAYVLWDGIDWDGFRSEQLSEPPPVAGESRVNVGTQVDWNWKANHLEPIN